MSSEHPSSELDTGGRGWLGRWLAAHVRAYDAAAAGATAAEVRRARPRGSPELWALDLAQRRLQGGGGVLGEGGLLRLAAAGEEPGAGSSAALLALQWDVLLDVACLHRSPGASLAARQLEVLTVMALDLEDFELARRLHRVHMELASDQALALEAGARRLEARLEERPRAGLTPYPLGFGLVSIETRALAGVASGYFARAAIDEAAVRRRHSAAQADKVALVGMLTALAWADGVVTPEERGLVLGQIERAELDRATARRMRAALDRGEVGELALAPVDADTRRVLLEQAVLLSLADDEQVPAERELLGEVNRRLGGTEAELEAVAADVAEFTRRNRELIRALGCEAGPQGRMRRILTESIQRAIRSNMRKLVQEVRETGELAQLLGAASFRELTPEEMQKVRAQLLDICKTIPALAIFLLPGGALLLPLLLKVLPFSLLPTAFGPDLTLAPSAASAPVADAAATDAAATDASAAPEPRSEPPPEAPS